MSSDRKVAANRRNALKSTGPRTLSGKAIASMNALKHGLCSRKPLIPGENEAEYEQFATDWVDETQPSTARQRLVVADTILAAWQLLRVAHLRAGLLTPAMVRAQKEKFSHPMSFSLEVYGALSKLDRHHALLQRTVERNMKLLEELQQEETADFADCADEEQNEATEPVKPMEASSLAPAPAPETGTYSHLRPTG